MTDYRWRTPSGEMVDLDRDILEALAAVQKHMPGAKAVWYRVPGESWRKP